MFKIGEIKAGQLADEQFPELKGLDFPIYGVSDQEEPQSNSIIFSKTGLSDDYQKVTECIFVTKMEEELCLPPSCIQLKSSMHKTVYGCLLEKIKSLLPKPEMKLVNGSYLSEDIKLGKNVKIAPFCVIGSDVEIGDYCEIGSGTIIKDHVRIGNHVQIQEKCMVGVWDLDVYREEASFVCRTLPHLAGTVIEDGCLLLAGCIVAAGDTRTTVLKKGSCVGLLGDVGHNCQIGEYTMVGGKSSISGHCNLGNHVYIAPMSVTTNRIEVGDRAYLGLGAVAIRDIPQDEKQFGNPARRVLEKGKKQ